MKTTLLSLLIVAILSTSIQARTPLQPKATGKMLILSDIHFNPFCDPAIVNSLVKTDYIGWQAIFETAGDSSYGKYGSDTYYRLLKSSMQAMKAQNKQPDMIIINGDFLSHNFQSVYTQMTGIANKDSFQSFVRKTTSFVFLMLSRNFPGVPVLPVLGNNDDYCGDYMIQPSGPFLSYFAALCEPNLHSVAHPGFASTCSKGGYYMATMPWDNSQVFIGLNTVFLSAKYTNACNPSDKSDPGWEELSWLRTTLASCAAQKKKVWLSYHIPPGMDVYASTSKQGPCATQAVTMWKPAYNDSFITLVNKYSSIIKAGFAGHTHMDDFRLLGNDSSVTSFIHITPAISPVYQNNPAFEEVTWDPTKMQITNTVTFRFQGIGSPGKNIWAQEYNYSKTYGITTMDANSMFTVWKRIGKDTALRNKYQQYYYVTHPGETLIPWNAYLCGIRYLTPAGFTKCYCSGK